MYIVSKQVQQDIHNIFNMCICSVIVCVFNCLYNISQWKHLLIITEPGGLRREQQMRTAWFVCGLLCGVTWVCGGAASSSPAKSFSTYQKPQLIQLHNFHVISHTASKHMSLRNQHRTRRIGKATASDANQEWEAGGNESVEDEVQFPTFKGDEDAGCSQWVIDHWVPESEGGQCQEGVDCPQTVQLHGWPTPSSKSLVF